MKLLHYTTILLFALVSVFMGCGENRQSVDQFPIGGDTVYIGRGTVIPLNAKPIKIQKPDTVFIHDTIYQPKTLRIKKAEQVNIGTNNGDLIINND